MKKVYALVQIEVPALLTEDEVKTLVGATIVFADSPAKPTGWSVYEGSQVLENYLLNPFEVDQIYGFGLGFLHNNSTIN